MNISIIDRKQPFHGICILVCAVSFFLHVSCSSGMITKKTAFENMSAVKNYYARTYSLPVDRLKEKTGKSGFFYVVSNEGKVLWHPLSYMNGADVSNIPMIKEILPKESGYGYYDQGGMKRVVFYESLGDGSKLFLSLDPEEFDEKK